MTQKKAKGSSMTKGKRRSGPKTLEEKVFNLDQAFAEEVRSGTAQQAKDRILKLDKYETELEEAKKEDQDLASKKDALRVANQTYSEPLKAIKLKRAFALKVLTEKGE